MTSVIVSSPYVAPGNTLKRLMIQVIIALLPGTLAYAWHFGPGVIINIVLAVLFALAFEAGILKLRAPPSLSSQLLLLLLLLLRLCLLLLS